MLFYEDFTARFYISGSIEPSLNLALEEYLFDRMEPDELILFVYVNRSSVIIGRHQNPWIECPVELLRENGIPLQRRISGGGTVYHDEGNLNFSFMMKKASFNKERNIRFVLRALERVGIGGSMSGRGDIIVSEKKVSGNAQCFRHEKALHHGTLLVRSDLRKLASLLQGTGEDIRTHAVASVRHPVANLSEFRSGLTTEQVIEALYAEFTRRFENAVPERFTELPDGAAGYLRKNDSWEWTYGKSPAFEIELPYTAGAGSGTLAVHVENGIIGSAVLLTGSTRMDLSSHLSGMRFDRMELTAYTER